MTLRPLSVVGISGNIKRPSKTRFLVNSVLQAIETKYGCRSRLFDLLDAPNLGMVWDQSKLTADVVALIEAIENADVLVVGSPVYKGSYAGLFKHLFDLIGQDQLASKPVILTASGGGDRHALIVEHQLRPLFGFFTASTIGTAIYASEADFKDSAISSDVVLKRIQRAVEELSPWFSLHDGRRAAVSGSIDTLQSCD